MQTTIKKPSGGTAQVNTRPNYSNNLDLVLGKLHKVKQTSHDQYIGCCPAHEDKNPSLAIRNDDGKIVLRCFAGCSAYEIVSALGVSITDLFPKKSSYSRPIKNPFPATSVLRCIQTEALIVATAACRMANGIEPIEEDKQRLILAASRIGASYE